MNNPINRVFCAFPIFCPSEEMYQRNMDSVVSFVEYVKLNPHLLDGSKGFILDIFYGGWSAKDEWFEKIKSYIKDNLPELLDGKNQPNNFVSVFRFDKNYGKAKVVNNLCFDYNLSRPDTQFLFTMDSDIKFQKDQQYFFHRLFTGARTLEEVFLKQQNIKKPFGFISLNQSGECCHWFEPQANGAKGMDQGIHYEIGTDNGLKMKEELVWPSDRMGVAGGCIFANFGWFRHIGGYRNFNTVYAGDDGFLAADAFGNGLSVCIIKTLSVIHPSNKDSEKYLKIKKESMKEAFLPYNETKYLENLKTSDEIW